MRIILPMEERLEMDLAFDSDSLANLITDANLLGLFFVFFFYSHNFVLTEPFVKFLSGPKQIMTMIDE